MDKDEFAAAFEALGYPLTKEAVEKEFENMDKVGRKAVTVPIFHSSSQCAHTLSLVHPPTHLRRTTVGTCATPSSAATWPRSSAPCNWTWSDDTSDPGLSPTLNLVQLASAHSHDVLAPANAANVTVFFFFHLLLPWACFDDTCYVCCCCSAALKGGPT